MKQVNKNALGYLALSAAASIWGGMYIVSKMALDFLPPFTLLWLRYAVGLTFLWLFVVRQGLRQPLARDWRLFMSIGFVGYFLSIGLQFIGTGLSSAHMGAILTSASPVFIVLFASYMLGEPITGRKMTALLLAMIGVIVVVGWDVQLLGDSRKLPGNLALIGAAVTWALLSVLAKKAALHYSPLVVTTYSIFWAFLFTTPVMVIEWQFLPVNGLDQPSVWFAVLYLGIVSTAGAFYLWNKGMHMVEAGTGSMFFFFQPVVGALLGWLLLGEHLSVSFFTGGLLILFGVLLMSMPVQERLQNRRRGETLMKR
ncbi:DMT family transporter [Aneurinibacillus sp. UBA3580]|jgi:drug/metabolite transporter (DMT)-like permease|uniref:DMT family transporter n=1 Tax=Aneurinibacillus sp. UBA3580 TaxID=1946041 RepID=UPI0025805451|nr:DMT family transporter [Aneurinibacillus sp. UBA3580]